MAEPSAPWCVCPNCGLQVTFLTPILPAAEYPCGGCYLEFSGEQWVNGPRSISDAAELDALALGRAVLRLLPDATPERLTALLTAGLAVERLERTGEWFELERTGLDYYLTCGGGLGGGAGATLPEAVAAALAELEAE